LLDEPTNHLDIQSVNILIQALQQYEGTFITVSHDRHFITGVANKIWYIENQEIKEYLGTYEEYVFWKSKQDDKPSEPKAVRKEKPVPVVTDDRNSEFNQAKKELKKKEKNLAELESQIMALEGEKTKVENKMADPAIYQDEKKLTEINSSYASLKAKIARLNEEWERLAMEIESLQETSS